MWIISFGVYSQVGQALGNYAWRWVPHPHIYSPPLWEHETLIRMSGSTLELTEAASIFSEVDMWIISFGVRSQFGQALGNYAWRWVPHRHIYSPPLWEHETVIRMSGSALELTEVASFFSYDDMWIISFGGHSQIGQAFGIYAWRWVPHPHMYSPTLWE